MARFETIVGRVTGQNRPFIGRDRFRDTLGIEIRAKNLAVLLLVVRNSLEIFDKQRPALGPKLLSLDPGATRADRSTAAHR
jgi:hypothetical protein